MNTVSVSDNVAIISSSKSSETAASNVALRTNAKYSTFNIHIFSRNFITLTLYTTNVSVSHTTKHIHKTHTLLVTTKDLTYTGYNSLCFTINQSCLLYITDYVRAAISMALLYFPCIYWYYSKRTNNQLIRPWLKGQGCIFWIFEMKSRAI